MIHPSRSAGPTAVASRPSRPEYPSFSESAATFAELFGSYLLTWPEAVADAYSDRWPDPRAYCDHLLRVAGRVVGEFPNLDLWDHLDEALRHTMKWYDPRKGPFDKLFEENLRERVRKSTARMAGAARRRSRAERAHAAEREGREEDAPGVAYDRWAGLLLDLATERLDNRTRTYLALRRGGESVADVAARLGTTERELNNQYGGAKLTRKVRSAVRELLLELPERHRRLLARHLFEEAGLGREQVSRLLGVAVAADESVPVLGEEPLLKILGWGGGKSPECAATTAAGRSMSSGRSPRAAA